MKRMIIVAVFCLVCNAVMAQNNGELPVYQSGNKVYIPYSEKNVAQKAGALKFRELISRDHLWNVVENEKDAQFVLDFVYSEEGVDHGLVKIKDRNGNLIAPTPTIKDSGRNLEEKGEMMAEASYDYIRKIGKGELEIENGYILFSGRRKGLIIRPEISLGLDDNTNIFFNLKGVVAYQFNPLFSVGCGIGMDYYDRYESISGIEDDNMDFKPIRVISIPLYINLRSYFCNKKWSPFLDLKLGYGVPVPQHQDFQTVNTTYWSTNNINYELDSYISGMMVNCELGMQCKGFDIGLVFGMFDANVMTKGSYTINNNINGNINALTEHIKYPKNQIGWIRSLSFNIAYNFQLKKKL